MTINSMLIEIFQIYNLMIKTFSKEEMDNWKNLMHSTDSDSNIIATEIFNSMKNTNYGYHVIGLILCQII